jgi:hypothetical protein
MISATMSIPKNIDIANLERPIPSMVEIPDPVLGEALYSDLEDSARSNRTESTEGSGESRRSRRSRLSWGTRSRKRTRRPNKPRRRGGRRPGFKFQSPIVITGLMPPMLSVKL